MNRIIVAVAILSVAACSSSRLSTEPVVYSQAEAADSVKVRVGQTIVVEGIRVRFAGVESDSRCPSDVVCVWAGDATANVVVELNCECDAAAIPLALHTGLEPHSGTAYGFRVELRSLLPYPNSASAIRPDGYSAWLKIVSTTDQS
jgi:hypothetical protein